MVMHSESRSAGPSSVFDHGFARAPQTRSPAPTPRSWRPVTLIDASGRSVELLVGDTPSGLRALLAAPELVRNGQAEPRLSATFLLDRQPTPSEPELRARVQRVVLGLDATLAPPAAALEQPIAGGERAQALFPDTVAFSLRRREGEELARVGVSSGQLTAALSATLERADAQRVLDALGGSDGGLDLCATITYRVPALATRKLRVTLDLALAHQRLRQGSSDGIVYDVDLVSNLAAMLRDGSATVEGDSLTTGDRLEVARACLPAFRRAASWLLEALPDDDRYAELGSRFRLGSSPQGPATLRFDTSPTTMSAAPQPIELACPLHELLRGVGSSATGAVRFVSVDDQGRGFEPLNRFVAQPKARLRTAEDVMAVSGSRLTNLSSAVRPAISESMSAHTLMLSEFVRPNDRVSIALPAQAVAAATEHLPLITSATPFWPDRLDANRSWYLPRFVPVMPRPTATANDTPFLFEFNVVGHGSEGRPTLEGSITLVLESSPPGLASRSALPGGAPPEPVPTLNLSVQLEIPFRDEQGNAVVESLRATRVDASGGSIKAHFALLDRWARVAYGVLSQPGFQAQSARVSVAYTYRAYATVTDWPSVAFGGKRLGLEQPELFAAAAPRALGTSRSAALLRLADGAELHLPALGKQRALPRRPPIEVMGETVVDRPVIVRPRIGTDPIIAPRQRTVLVRRAYSEAFDVSYPCAVHGALYVENRARGTGEIERAAIGCQQAYSLGQTEHRLYERLTLPLGLVSGQVYRSLQSPGRFVHVPEAYRIARFPADDAERAHRPSVLLYSTVDVDDLQKSRCVVLCSLEPSGGAAESQRLLDHLLREHHPAARVEYLTEIDGELSFSWSLPTGGGGLLALEAEAARTSRGFEVSLVTDAFGLPQVQAILANSGVTGSVRLTLPDGSGMTTNLRLHLKEIVGPSPDGPLAQELVAGPALRLTNRIESPVNVRDILLVDAAGRISATTPAGLRLEAGKQATVTLPVTPARAVVDCQVESTAASLVEIRSFIEDLTLTVILFNRVDLAAFELSQLDVTVSIPGVGGTSSVQFNEGAEPAQTARFVLPLTTYVSNPNLELRATLTDRRGTARELGSISWHLDTQGYVVSITPGLLALQ